eukprot:GHVO01070680.1.p1 GENE.GHVO01070680.1~~GHVO01070680.1.p1  ORF type:complete len:149 (-),score=5.28 GHVO01070680.1:213-659(-)
MRTETIKIYSFDELSKEAKENALEYQRENWHYSWGYEAIKSLEAFAKLIGLKINNYQIDWLNPQTSYFKYDDTNINKDFYLHAETELTGYAMDYVILRAWNETKSINETLNRFLWNCCADYEEQLTDESIEEYLDHNDYEFTEDGTIY